MIDWTLVSEVRFPRDHSDKIQIVRRPPDGGMRSDLVVRNDNGTYQLIAMQGTFPLVARDHFEALGEALRLLTRLEHDAILAAAVATSHSL
jgi:hypothetical protein